MSRKKYIWMMIIISIVIIITWKIVIPKKVESIILEKAEKKGFNLDIGETNTSLSHILLHNVKFQNADNSIKGEIQEISIGYDFDLSITSIEAVEGNVRISKSLDELKKKFNSEGKTGKDSSFEKKVRNFKILWEEPLGSGSEIEASGLSYIDSRFDIFELKITKKGNKATFIDAHVTKEDDTYIISSKSIISRIEVAELKNSTEKLSGKTEVEIPNVDLKSESGSVFLLWKEYEFKDLEVFVSKKKELKVKSRKISYDKKMFGKDLVVDGKLNHGNIEGEVYLSSLKFKNDKLTDKEIDTGKIGFKGMLIDRKELIGDLILSKITIHSRTKYENRILNSEIEVDETKCEDIVSSIPESMLQTLSSKLSMSGVASLSFQVEVPINDRKESSVRLKMKNGCKIESIPDSINVEKLKKPFVMTVYDEKKNEKEITTGPGTKYWVPLMLMSKYVPIAFKTTEDPGFMSHNGFHIEAIENSIKLNIIDGKFTRGASTITMQLAKNLWLNRKKMLSRKVEEAILTIYLEQSLSKEKILETYLNIVEFGPNMYGIGNASKHYFNVHPMNLSLSQSLFLASLLPNPLKNGYEYKKEVSRWKLSWLHRVMKAMKDRQLISEDEYETGIKEKLIYGISSSDLEEEEELLIGDGINPNEWEAN